MSSPNCKIGTSPSSQVIVFDAGIRDNAQRRAMSRSPRNGLRQRRDPAGRYKIELAPYATFRARLRSIDWRLEFDHDVPSRSSSFRQPAYVQGLRMFAGGSMGLLPADMSYRAWLIHARSPAGYTHFHRPRPGPISFGAMATGVSGSGEFDWQVAWFELPGIIVATEPGIPPSP